MHQVIFVCRPLPVYEAVGMILSHHHFTIDIKKIINEDIIGDVTTIDFISLEQKECEKLIRNL